MAENVEILDIDLSQLNEEAQQTTKTLKDLRNEVKGLREQLNNTAIGTEEFENTLSELEEKQKELSNVTKSSNKAIEGSYDDLAQQMSALKKEWRATADVAERSDIGSKILELNNQLKSMDAEIGNYQRNVGNYGSVLEGLSGTINNTSDATEGITSMFSSAVMVLGSMGLESEEMTKILQKMQLAMALTRGLKDLQKGKGLFEQLTKAISGANIAQKLFNSSIATTTTETQALTGAQTANTVATTGATAATNAFRTALISTGIGAVVVAIGALVANLNKLTSIFETNKADADKYKNTLSDLNEQFDGMDDHLDREVRLMKAQGASIDEVHAKQLKNLEIQRDMIASKMRSIQLDIAQLQANRHWFDGGDKKIKNWKEAYDELAKSFKDVGKEISKLNADFDVDKQIESINNQKSAYDAAADAAKKARQEYQAYFKLRETNQKKLNDLADEATRTTMSDREKELADAQMWAYDQYDMYNNMYKEEQKALKKALKDRVITQEEYDSKMALVKENYEGVVTNIRILYNDKVQKLADKWAKEDADREKKKKDDKIKALQDTYNAEMALIEAEYNEAAAKYELLGDQVGLSKANEEFYKNQLDKLNTLRDGLIALGVDTTDVDMQIRGVLLQQQQAFLITFQAKADKFTELTDQLSDSISRITSIGDGLSSEWSNVFTTMSEGIQRVSAELKNGEKGWRQYANIAVSALNVASSMMIALADEQNGQSEEGFEQQKKYQIAAATMSMLGGIVDAWTSAMNPANAWMTMAGQIAVGTAMSAMIAATGAMQINKIKQQKFGGNSEANVAGGINGAVAVPSLTALQSIDSGVDTTSIIQGASEEGNVNNTKVYVTETDISGTVNKVNVTQAEATF